MLSHKREEVAGRKRLKPLAEIRRAAEAIHGGLGFRSALASGPRPALIAEIKRASPSRGLLRPDLDAGMAAELYAANGASAISVLTDGKFFHGSLKDLRTVAQTVKAARGLPVLQKDFIVDPYQIYEAKLAGADAILLIVAALDEGELVELHGCVRDLALDALVEVHTDAELERAMRIDPTVVGINNRDLATFDVDLETTARLRKRIPDGAVVVAESGIRTAADVDRVRAMGVNAILVGEAIVRSHAMAAKVRELAGR